MEKIPSIIYGDYSLFTHCSFDAIKNKHDCYRSKYYMKIDTKI